MSNTYTAHGTAVWIKDTAVCLATSEAYAQMIAQALNAQENK